MFKHKKSTIIFLFSFCLLFIYGCDSVAPENPAVESSNQFKLTGAVNTSFQSVNVNYTAKAGIIPVNDSYRLQVLLSASGSANELNEQADVIFTIEFSSNSGLLPPGNYQFNKSDIENIGSCSYQYRENKNNFVRVRMQAESLALKVDSNDNEIIIGRFSLTLQPETAERMKHGIFEHFELAGPVRAVGDLNLKVDKIN